jgi:hypothetical protein
VRAAAGHAAEVEVVPEGAGYRIRAISGDTRVEMYLELRPDGSVEERTELRATDATLSTTPGGGEVEVARLSDDELLGRLRTALGDVVMSGLSDPAGRQNAWQRVVEGIRDLERRYPPETG